MSITVFTTAHHLYISSAKLIQSTLFFLTNVAFNIIFRSTPVFQVVTFLQVSAPKIGVPFSSHPHVPRTGPPRPPWLDHPTRVWCGTQIIKNIIMESYLVLVLVVIHILFHGSTVLVGLGILCEIPGLHSNIPHSVGLLWTSDRTVVETLTWQH